MLPWISHNSKWFCFLKYIKLRFLCHFIHDIVNFTITSMYIKLRFLCHFIHDIVNFAITSMVLTRPERYSILCRSFYYCIFSSLLTTVLFIRSRSEWRRSHIILKKISQGSENELATYVPNITAAVFTLSHSLSLSLSLSLCLKVNVTMLKAHSFSVFFSNFLLLIFSYLF